MSLSVTLNHRFGDFTLEVAFDAPKGITMLYGRSGSGKTTIVNALAGLLQPDAGRIEVDGWEVFNHQKNLSLPPHARRVGYIFQEARLFPHLSVRQNLKFGQWFAGVHSDPAEMRRIVDMLGIGHLLDRRPSRLSGGEKQRVAIGRALLAHPRLILADEPLAALDAERKADILPYFERLRDELEVPIVYVSHAGDEVTRLADTVVVLDEGCLVRQGAAADVLSDPTVTPLGAAAAGVMLEARVIRHYADGISEVDAGGMVLLLPRVDAPIETELRLRIAAQDVMLATKHPEDISALNVLPATITALRLGDGPGALVQLRVGENLLLSRITRRSAASLKLEIGTQVFAVLKAVSIPRGTVSDTSSELSTH